MQDHIARGHTVNGTEPAPVQFSIGAGFAPADCLKSPGARSRGRRAQHATSHDVRARAQSDSSVAASVSTAPQQPSFSTASAKPFPVFEVATSGIGRFKLPVASGPSPVWPAPAAPPPAPCPAVPEAATLPTFPTFSMGAAGGTPSKRKGSTTGPRSAHKGTPGVSRNGEHGRRYPDAPHPPSPWQRLADPATPSATSAASADSLNSSWASSIANLTFAASVASSPAHTTPASTAAPAPAAPPPPLPTSSAAAATGSATAAATGTAAGTVLPGGVSHVNSTFEQGLGVPLHPLPPQVAEMSFADLAAKFQGLMASTASVLQMQAKAQGTPTQRSSLDAGAAPVPGSATAATSTGTAPAATAAVAAAAAAPAAVATAAAPAAAAPAAAAPAAAATAAPAAPAPAAVTTAAPFMAPASQVLPDVGGATEVPAPPPAGVAFKLGSVPGLTTPASATKAARRKPRTPMASPAPFTRDTSFATSGPLFSSAYSPAPATPSLCSNPTPAPAASSTPGMKTPAPTSQPQPQPLAQQQQQQQPASTPLAAAQSLPRAPSPSTAAAAAAAATAAAYSPMAWSPESLSAGFTLPQTPHTPASLTPTCGAVPGSSQEASPGPAGLHSATAAPRAPGDSWQGFAVPGMPAGTTAGAPGAGSRQAGGTAGTSAGTGPKGGAAAATLPVFGKPGLSGGSAWCSSKVAATPQSIPGASLASDTAPERDTTSVKGGASAPAFQSDPDLGGVGATPGCRHDPAPSVEQGCWGQADLHTANLAGSDMAGRQGLFGAPVGPSASLGATPLFTMPLNNSGKAATAAGSAAAQDPGSASIPSFSPMFGFTPSPLHTPAHTATAAAPAAMTANGGGPASANPFNAQGVGVQGVGVGPAQGLGTSTFPFSIPMFSAATPPNGTTATTTSSSASKPTSAPFAAVLEPASFPDFASISQPRQSQAATAPTAPIAPTAGEPFFVAPAPSGLPGAQSAAPQQPQPTPPATRPTSQLPSQPQFQPPSSQPASQPAPQLPNFQPPSQPPVHPPNHQSCSQPQLQATSCQPASQPAFQVPSFQPAPPAAPPPDGAAGWSTPGAGEGAGGSRVRARRCRRTPGGGSTRPAADPVTNLAHMWQTQPDVSATSAGGQGSSSKEAPAPQAPVVMDVRPSQQPQPVASGAGAESVPLAAAPQPWHAAAAQPVQPAQQQQQQQEAVLPQPPLPPPVQQQGQGQTSGTAPAAKPSNSRGGPAERVQQPAGVTPQAAQQAAKRAEASLYKERGNTQYAAQQYGEADTSYTTALAAHTAALGSAPDAAVLYSNRAGARLMVGRPGAALEDALRAVQLDPRFFRAVSRAATCYCRMGNFNAAKAILDRALDRMSASSSHFQDLYKKLREVEGLQAATRQACAVLVTAAGSGAVDKLGEGLAALAELHPQVAYSEAVAAAKACALLAAGKPSEALAVCDLGYEAPPSLTRAPWRLWLQTQAQYHLGELQAALGCATRLASVLQQLAAPACSQEYEKDAEAFGGNSIQALAGAALQLPTLAQLDATSARLQQLMALKEEGNAAVKATKLTVAVEKYTAALALLPPPGFAAVLHSNRAAAYQGLQSLTDAMADCGRAKALDPGYARATTRLASILQGMRRAGAAAELLDAALKAGSGVVLSTTEKEAVTAQAAAARATAVWQTAADHYQMLGLERSCTEEEVRKAYRRAALKHHPDKAVAACRFSAALPVNSPGDGPGLAASVVVVGVVQAVESRVRQEANWLFNLISQASDELSDKARRAKLDMQLDSQLSAPPAARPYANPFNRPYSSTTTSSSTFHGNSSNFYSSYGASKPSWQQQQQQQGSRGYDPAYHDWGTFRPSATTRGPAASGTSRTAPSTSQPQPPTGPSEGSRSGPSNFGASSGPGGAGQAGSGWAGTQRHSGSAVPPAASRPGGPAPAANSTSQRGQGAAGMGGPARGRPGGAGTGAAPFGQYNRAQAREYGSDGSDSDTFN